MDNLTTIVLAVALAMDCLAVSVCVGASHKRFKSTATLRIAVAFGFFQALMPLIGWAASAWLGPKIESISHFVAFALLAFVGAKMLWEALRHSGDKCNVNVSSWRILLWLTIATSIDALAVGVSYGVLQIEILQPCIVIGVVSSIFAVVGAAIGVFLGHILGNKAEIIGGVVLILLALKVLFTF